MVHSTFSGLVPDLELRNALADMYLMLFLQTVAVIAYRTIPFCSVSHDYFLVFCPAGLDPCSTGRKSRLCASAFSRVSESRNRTKYATPVPSDTSISIPARIALMCALLRLQSSARLVEVHCRSRLAGCFLPLERGYHAKSVQAPSACAAGQTVGLAHLLVCSTVLTRGKTCPPPNCQIV